MLEGGLYNYLEAAAFGGQCFGLHMGDKQQSNLGDGSANQEDSSKNHQLGLNVSDSGKDLLVGNATNIAIEGHLGINTTFTGETVKRGWRYRTTVDYIDDLVPANRTRWNHYTGVQAIGAEVSDGLVAVLTIQVTKDDPGLLGDQVWSALGM
ncbi:hypothetical protein L486_02644 [Kwoniella mangroviensis CBS 10435]|uniref:Uncharacterized protein n=1 Tax=Kwoniella mangroviensis CBS 10435 TaxID=1331196 RepID=A0A1B9IWR6_9TREE|nr:hypothetical protein L486_02644 [Kwoniella mangroviensis CBS 10435]